MKRSTRKRLESLERGVAELEKQREWPPRTITTERPLPDGRVEATTYYGKFRHIEICRCGAPANHTSSQAGVTTRSCCKCHVAAGGIPADWHPQCLRQADERRQQPR